MVMVNESAKIYIGRHRSGQSSGDLDLSFNKEWFEQLCWEEKKDVIFWLKVALKRCEE